ncbi:winged helix DNA-binding domain-containing protein, partial [Trametes sanguinea]
MRPDGFQYDRGARGDLVIPGQTRIHLPLPNASHEGDIPFTPEPPTVLRSGDDAVYRTTDDEIRRYLGLGPDEPLSLDALADPPPGQRPGQSIPILSQLAILGSPNKRLTLQEIYLALEHRFEWFRNNRHDKSWQNSIRHNLSLYKCFRRMSKPITEPGKGSYWVVD